MFTMVRENLRSIWKVAFCVSAVFEIQYMWRQVNACRVDDNDNEFTINYNFADRAWESASAWASPIFCSLCLIESFVRAVEARMLALDNRLLSELEESLLHAAQKSSDRLSIFFTGAVADQGHTKMTKRVSKVLRSWIPAIATIALWLSILPTDLADFHHRCGHVQYRDSAVATQSMRRMSLKCSNMLSSLHGLLEKIFWTNILPYRIYKQPQRFIQRLKVILRWIRFARFAGPLFRMGLKLQNQMRAVWKARCQTEKESRKNKRDLLADIQKLLQQKVVQATLALPRIPSFSLNSQTTLKRISSSVVASFNRKRTFGKKILDQLEQIQKDYHHRTTSDLYDRLAQISHEINVTHRLQSAGSHNYLKPLLSSSDYLISPRFVTC